MNEISESNSQPGPGTDHVICAFLRSKKGTDSENSPIFLTRNQEVGS